MSMAEIVQHFVTGMKQTSIWEYLAVFSGIASVYFSRIENIWVYPVGLISTSIYIWLSVEGHLFGEAAVNLYYTIMSIYGWIIWSKLDQRKEHMLHVTNSNLVDWMRQLLFFGVFYVAIFVALSWLKQSFAPGAIPWADAFASASAFTGMWLMVRKKVASWWWWIITNIASIPLYFVKGYVFTSVLYFVLLIMAVWGLIEWTRRASGIIMKPLDIKTDTAHA